MSNYPPGFSERELNIPENPCPDCGEELKAMFWFKDGQKVDPTNSFECLDCGHTITVQEYEKVS